MTINKRQVRFDESWLGPLAGAYAAVRMASMMRMLDWDIIYAPTSPPQPCESHLQTYFDTDWDTCLTVLSQELYGDKS